MTLPNFEENLAKYAHLIVKEGVNTKENDTVVVKIAADQYLLARLIVKEAYKAGAKNVVVQWQDDVVKKEFIANADEAIISKVNPFERDQDAALIEENASRITIVSSAPDALEGVPSDRLQAWQKAYDEFMAPLRKYTSSNRTSWTIAAAASAEWAATVFADMNTSAEQVDALWDAIFKATRIYTDDPVAAWKEHDHILHEKADMMNEIQYDSLHYKAPGTDLVVGLPENHIWAGGSSKNITNGEVFMANMPTEEIFTAPDYRRIDGYVTSTKPLSYAGNLINNFKLTFKDGQIVDVEAEEGEEVLKELIATDKGSKSLGEVALVPDPSPISQSGIIFYNTLFDENASDHLAIGNSYAFTIQDGTDMSNEELLEHGMNRSSVHVDFMIGSADMDIDGIRKDGTVDAVFRNGDWA